MLGTLRLSHELSLRNHISYVIILYDHVSVHIVFVVLELNETFYRSVSD